MNAKELKFLYTHGKAWFTGNFTALISNPYQYVVFVAGAGLQNINKTQLLLPSPRVLS